MKLTAGTPEFIPHPWLYNPHAMTIMPAFLPRKLEAGFAAAAQERLFQVEPGTQLLAHCHFQKEREACPTLILIHGLEGSSQSAHMIATAQKAFALGLNAIRLNLRNCGGTMHLTPTLYNAGLSKDLICVVEQLMKEGMSDIFAAGFSLGGNIVLKAAGELGASRRSLLAGVAAVCPSIDLDLSVTAIERSSNRVYELWFLRTLKEKIKQKEKLFPGTFDVLRLPQVRTLRQFDDLYTAPSGGYGRADNYYRQASALKVIDKISIPALIVAAQDDPMVPFSMFESPAMNNPSVELISTRYGGHTGFVHRASEGSGVFDRFWAENRIVSFCLQHARTGLTS